MTYGEEMPDIEHREIGAVISDLESEYARSKKFLDDLCLSLQAGPTSRLAHLADDGVTGPCSTVNHDLEGDSLADAVDVPATERVVDVSRGSLAVLAVPPAAHVQLPPDGHTSHHSPKVPASALPPHAVCPVPRQSLDLKSTSVRFGATEARGPSNSGLATRVSRKLLNMFNHSPSMTRSAEAPAASDSSAQAGIGGEHSRSPGAANPPAVILPPSLALFVPTPSHVSPGGHRRTSVELLSATAAHRRKSLETILPGYAAAPSVSGSSLADLVRSQQHIQRTPSSGFQTTVAQVHPRPSNIGHPAQRRTSYSLPPVSPQQQQPQPLQAWHLQQPQLHSSRSIRQREQQCPSQRADAQVVAPAPFSSIQYVETSSAPAASVRVLHSSLDQSLTSAIGSGAIQGGGVEHLPPLPNSHSAGLVNIGGNIGGHCASPSSANMNGGRRSSGSSCGDGLQVGPPAAYAALLVAPCEEAHYRSTELPRPRTGRFSSRVVLMGQPVSPASPLASAASATSAVSPCGRDARRQSRRSSSTGEALERLPPRSPCAATAATADGGNAEAVPFPDSAAPNAAGDGCIHCGSPGGSPESPVPLLPVVPLRSSGTGELWRASAVVAARPPPERSESGAADGAHARHLVGRSDAGQGAGPFPAPWSQSSFFAPASVVGATHSQ